MGELRYIFADPKSAKSQIELSALIRAMVDHPSGQMFAVMRYVHINDSAPFMVVARGVKDDNGGDHLECVRVRPKAAQAILYDEGPDAACFLIVQVPFQDDYRRNYFPSLEFPKNDQGDLVTDHSTLPTSEQKRVMGALIDKSILNTLGENGCARSRKLLSSPDIALILRPHSRCRSTPWFTPELSYSPMIHTLKAFQQHQALASPSDPPPAMHSYLTRYLKPPAEVIEATKGLGKRVADAFDLRPGTPTLLSLSA